MTPPIGQHSKERYFRPGQYLFRENDPAQALFIISKGSVAIRKRHGSGEVDLARLNSNEVVGELAFFDRLPRSASAVAVTEVTAIEIQFSSLDTIWAQVPAYLKTIITAIVERLRKADDTIRRLQKEESSTEKSEEPGKEADPDIASVLAQIDTKPPTGNKPGQGPS